MIIDYEVFKEPSDENATIWRYLDFTKFVSLLQREALFFPTGESLKKADAFEGSLPEKNVVSRHTVYKFAVGDSEIDLQLLINSATMSNRGMAKFVLINSWHVNPHESAAMWKLYLKSDEGIAIRSTFKKLKASLSTQESLGIGLVNYIDYEKESFIEKSIFNLFLHKRKSFEHEQELRAIIFTLGDERYKEKDGSFNFVRAIDKDIYDGKDGDYIPICVDDLIEKVYIAPSAPLWFYELVKAIAKKYGLAEYIVTQSNLAKNPLY